MEEKFLVFPLFVYHIVFPLNLSRCKESIFFELLVLNFQVVVLIIGINHFISHLIYQYVVLLL